MVERDSVELIRSTVLNTFDDAAYEVSTPATSQNKEKSVIVVVMNKAATARAEWTSACMRQTRSINYPA